MNALFVANIELAETEGIYKKVEAEAAAIGKVLGELFQQFVCYIDI